MGSFGTTGAVCELMIVVLRLDVATVAAAAVVEWVKYGCFDGAFNAQTKWCTVWRCLLCELLLLLLLKLNKRQIHV